jgi:hypothetical protein
MPGIALFFRRIFGSVSWSAPAWLQELIQQAKVQPLRFYSAVVMVGLLILAAGAGYYYYQQLPKPLKVLATVTAPPVGYYQDDTEQATPLTLQFAYEPGAATPVQPLQLQPRSMPAMALSAARLDLIGEVLNEGVNISPAISGKWLWQDENTLTFTPEQAWPAATEYQLTLDQRIFASGIVLAKNRYRFSSAALQPEVNQLRFYQHPTEKATRQVVATLNFSHPVQLASVKDHISLRMRPDASDISHNATSLPYTLSADKTGREIYLQSESLTLPAQEQYLTLQLDAGIKALTGNGETTVAVSEQLLVPDKTSFLKVAELRTDIVRTPELEPEQMLLLSFTDRINRSELQQKLKLYQLPKHPKRNTDYWAAGEVNSSILQHATPLSFELMPTAEPHANAFSIKLDLPPGQSVFVSLAKGLLSSSDFSLSNEYRAVVRAPDYPKEARIVGEGALLTLSGEPTLQLLSRGLSGVRVRLHKLLDGELNHFISQSGGDISQPYFNHYQFN